MKKSIIGSLFLASCSTSRLDLNEYEPSNIHVSDCIFAFEKNPFDDTESEHITKIINLCEEVYGN